MIIQTICRFPPLFLEELSTKGEEDYETTCHSVRR